MIAKFSTAFLHGAYFLKKYNWHLGCSVIVLLLATSTVWANVDTSGYKFSAYGGWQKQIIHPGSYALIGDETEQLVPDHSRATNFSWGLGTAYRFLTPNHKNILRYTHDISMGLDIFYFQATQNGRVMDYGESYEFDYRTKIQSLRFIGNMEWTFLPITSKAIYPFLEVGAGLASNANYYSDTPNSNSSNGVGITFSRHDIIQFAYDLGAGFKYMPSKNVEVSLRYLYSNLGSVRSGTKASLPIDTAYNFSLKTQSLFLGLSYLL